MTESIELERDTEGQQEPERAAKWKNRWVVRKACIIRCPLCLMMKPVDPGDEVDSCCGVWPSAKAARDNHELLMRMEGKPFAQHYAYVGPFRVPS